MAKMNGEAKAAARYRENDAPIKDSLGLYFGDVSRNAEFVSHEQETELAKRVEAGLAAAAMLSGELERTVEASDEELEWLRADGDLAKERLIQSCMRWVIKIARDLRYVQTPTFQFADSIQAGNIGLNRAVEKFDYTTGYRLTTYSTAWIKQMIRRDAANESRTVRLPVHMVEELQRLERAQAAFLAEHDRIPTEEELANKLEVDVERVFHLLEVAKKQPVSLNLPIGSEGDVELGDLLVGEEGRDGLFRELDARLVREALLATMDTVLTLRESDVLMRRFGMYGRIESLDEVGERWGVTKERVRQIQFEAIRKLRASMSSEDGTMAQGVE